MAPRIVEIGSVVRVRHSSTGRYLKEILRCSDNDDYQPLIVATENVEDADDWQVEVDFRSWGSTRNVSDGLCICLRNCRTGRRLHSHSPRLKIDPFFWPKKEVTAFSGHPNGNGDVNDFWKIELFRAESWKEGQEFNLRHVGAPHEQEFPKYLCSDEAMTHRELAPTDRGVACAIEPSTLSRWTATDVRSRQTFAELEIEKCRASGSSVLVLRGLGLPAVPQEVCALAHLETLDLAMNRIADLPSCLVQMPNLLALYLHLNPSLEIPDEILGPPKEQNSKPKHPREILDYYFRIKGSLGRPLDECKLIVVGRGGAGKTSLTKRLRGLLYDPNEPETHGITIDSLTFRTDRDDIACRIWDFGGQVVLHSMHEFFLTARSLYLLVLGEREDMLERDASYWLQLIRSYAGNAPVVVALNKSAGRQRQFDQGTLEKNYGPILGWVHTECSESDDDAAGISKLKAAISSALGSAHMESARKKFPAKWFAIKDALQNMRESFISYDAYIGICERHNENNQGEQAKLAKDLHDLGVALNYANDPRLFDTTILQPNWLANGIYAILRANDLDKKLPPEYDQQLAPDGVITLEILAKIHQKAEHWGMLHFSHYPRDKQAFLLRLMQSFHLCYPLDNDGKLLLVPSLLPLQPPCGAIEPTGSDCLLSPTSEKPESESPPVVYRVRFDFEVVPAPLILWFIARTFSLIPNKLHWRRGALLKFGDANALVSATQDERYVHVTVGGPRSDRDDLLMMIRSTLYELFQDYRGLRVNEHWRYNERWVPRETLEDMGKLAKLGVMR